MKTLSRSLFVFAMAWVALLATPVQVTAVETPFSSEEVVYASYLQVDEAPAAVLASGRHWRHYPPHGYFRHPGKRYYRGGDYYRHFYRRPFAHRHNHYGRHFRAYPYRDYGYGRGGHGYFGITGCFTSGSVRICINNRYGH